MKTSRYTHRDLDLFNFHKQPLQDGWRVNDVWLEAGVIPTAPETGMDSYSSNYIMGFDYQFYICGLFQNNKFEIGSRDDFINLKDILLLVLTSEFARKKKVFMAVS